MTTSTDRLLGLGSIGLVVRLWSHDDGVISMRVEWPTGPRPESRARATPTEASQADLDTIRSALAEWPRPTRHDWTGHPAFPRSGTRFQRLTWQALCTLAPGETISYAELARRIGRPGATRAVGQAVGANPWAPLVPCHRVIAGDGSLGGYAGGQSLKAALLRIEGVELPSG
jgi:methylated-DNA-[protein]-cysteine S-methyltransferase